MRPEERTNTRTHTHRDGFAHEKAFVGGGAHPIERRAVAKACGEDGMGRIKSGPIAYRATPGRLA